MKRYVTTRLYLAEYIGPGEFYSGIATGDRVIVREETTVYTSPTTGERKANVGLSVTSVNGGIGPWLWLPNIARLANIEEL